MALFGKGTKKGKQQSPAAAQAAPKMVRPKPNADVYTLLLGLSVLALLVAVVVLGINYQWYSSQTPPILPLSGLPK
jgi:hypothetical protein